MIRLSLEEWIEQFRPKPNHITPTTCADYGDGPCLYETFGPELDYIAGLNEAGAPRSQILNALL